MTECIIWLWSTDRCGYGFIQYEGKLRKAHRVSYALANNLPIDSLKGKIVRHKCDNPHCVNPDHLELGTHQDNEDDKTSRGRRPMGSLVGTAKLTEEVVLAIRAEYKRYSKESGSIQLGRKYGVNPSTIRYLISSKSWSHVI